MDNWTLGSVMIGIGLNWWQSIVVIFVSQMISSIAMCINSRVGETYHIGYPIVCRSVFGLYGAYYTVAARAVLAVVYYAIKCRSGFLLQLSRSLSDGPGQYMWVHSSL
jgi:NCS1 family nucleobase:cation symporter-1